MLLLWGLFLSFNCSWAAWVQRCWARSQRRCGSMSKCCSVSHLMSGLMPTRWLRSAYSLLAWEYHSTVHRPPFEEKYFFVCVFFQIPFFDDVGAVTLQYFDSLFQRDNLQKSQFYKGLPKVLPKLPKVNAANKPPPPKTCLQCEYWRFHLHFQD